MESDSRFYLHTGVNVYSIAHKGRPTLIDSSKETAYPTLGCSTVGGVDFYESRVAQ